MQLVLVGAAVVSIVALQDVSTGLVVIGLTVLNAVMGLHAEGKAAESVAALRQMLIMNATVRLLLRLVCTRQSDVPSTPREVRVILGDFGSGQFFWSMVWFTLFFIWIWLLFIVFGDIFRSPDLSGWGKGLWSIFIIFVPYLGIFVYLIARGHKMQEHAVQQAQQQDAAMREYVQSVTTTGGAADEIARLAELRDKGAITDAEFQQAKAKALQ
jgi:Short C-terminal domain